VTYVAGESWCWNHDQQSCPTNYTVTYAREFRYEDARERYLERALKTVDFANGIITPDNGGVPGASDRWTDYEGGEAYADFKVQGTTLAVIEQSKYEPGAWRFDVGLGAGEYLHGDHLGTLRQTSDELGGAGTGRVFTAFGEQKSGPQDRYGYVGAFGYQRPRPGFSAYSTFPFLHVGARYYDPASGRFLQRDPIGVRSGSNVYEYAFASPLAWIDPDGRFNDNSMNRMRPGPGGGIIQEPYRSGKPSVVDIARETRDEAGGKGDDWAHFVATCRIASECDLGPLIVGPVAWLKEAIDQSDFGPNRDPVSDTLWDLYADFFGAWRGMRRLVFGGMTCAEAADQWYGR
jgi:RHS repeat-associated protein